MVHIKNLCFFHLKYSKKIHINIYGYIDNDSIYQINLWSNYTLISEQFDFFTDLFLKKQQQKTLIRNIKLLLTILYLHHYLSKMETEDLDSLAFNHISKLIKILYNKKK